MPRIGGYRLQTLYTIQSLVVKIESLDISRWKTHCPFTFPLSRTNIQISNLVAGRNTPPLTLVGCSDQVFVTDNDNSLGKTDPVRAGNIQESTYGNSKA